MHPSSALIVWLAAVLATQFLAYAGLGLLALGVLLARPSAGRNWLGYIWRARWLLLSLWLVLAYNTPGEAFLGLSWGPTYEGMVEANLQAIRLVVMLGCLAWLFGHLGRDGLIAGLWGLLQPLGRLGLDSRQLVVRLSLVLDNLQQAPRPGGWRKMLSGEDLPAQGVMIVKLAMPRWAARDSLLSGLAMAFLLGAALS